MVIVPLNCMDMLLYLFACEIIPANIDLGDRSASEIKVFCLRNFICYILAKTFLTFCGIATAKFALIVGYFYAARLIFVPVNSYFSLSGMVIC